MCQHDGPGVRVGAGPGRESEQVRQIRFGRAAAVGACLALAAGLGACVDHDSNAETFCEKNEELLNPASDNINYSEDVARFVSDELEKTMRYAEDATREVRLAARDMADAYLDKADLAADDDATEDELEENQEELQEAREDTRQACGDFLGTGESDA
jgi:hypothetical protein